MGGVGAGVGAGVGVPADKEREERPEIMRAMAGGRTCTPPEPTEPTRG